MNHGHGTERCRRSPTMAMNGAHKATTCEVRIQKRPARCGPLDHRVDTCRHRCLLGRHGHGEHGTCHPQVNVEAWVLCVNGCPSRLPPGALGLRTRKLAVLVLLVLLLLLSGRWDGMEPIVPPQAPPAAARIATRATHSAPQSQIPPWWRTRAPPTPPSTPRCAVPRTR